MSPHFLFSTRDGGFRLAQFLLYTQALFAPYPRDQTHCEVVSWQWLMAGFFFYFDSLRTPFFLLSRFALIYIF